MQDAQSILLVSPSHQTALKDYFSIDITTQHVDRLVLESDTTIGIEEIRNSRHFVLSPPIMQTQKQLIIIQAQRLTPEAQNALLKLLEEPPSYLQIILIAVNHHQLLETIISRCFIVHHQQQHAHTQPNPLYQSLIQAGPSQRLSSLPPTTTKQAALELCQQLIQAAAIHLRQTPTPDSAANLNYLLACQDHIQQNANPTLAVTDAVLSLLPHE